MFYFADVRVTTAYNVPAGLSYFVDAANILVMQEVPLPENRPY